GRGRVEAEQGGEHRVHVRHVAGEVAVPHADAAGGGRQGVALAQRPRRPGEVLSHARATTERPGRATCRLTEPVLLVYARPSRDEARGHEPEMSRARPVWCDYPIRGEILALVGARVPVN